MKKILLINAFLLITGYGIAQTAKVTGDFENGLRCVSPTQSASFKFVNASGNLGGITKVKWEIKDTTGIVINTDSNTANNLSYTYHFSQAGTYQCVMSAYWANTIRIDSMKVIIHTMPQFSFVKSRMKR